MTGLTLVEFVLSIAGTYAGQRVALLAARPCGRFASVLVCNMPIPSLYDY